MDSSATAIRTLADALRAGSFLGLAVHWDMDGTLVDSEPLHVQKLVHACALRGVSLTPEHFATPQSFEIPDGSGGSRPASMALHGAGDKNAHSWLLAQRPELAGTLSQRAWLDELMGYYLARASNLALREGIGQAVHDLHGLGALQSIVTSATAPQLRACGQALRDALPLMSFAINADDVERSKPDPQGYLRAKGLAADHWAGRGVDARAVFQAAVEDSPTGVRAALAAGLPCVQFILPGQPPFRA